MCAAFHANPLPHSCLSTSSSNFFFFRCNVSQRILFVCHHQRRQELNRKRHPAQKIRYSIIFIYFLLYHLPIQRCVPVCVYLHFKTVVFLNGKYGKCTLPKKCVFRDLQKKKEAAGLSLIPILQAIRSPVFFRIIFGRM